MVVVVMVLIFALLYFLFLRDTDSGTGSEPPATAAPETTAEPVTTAAPETTAAPVTTAAPETTAAPATTGAPETTAPTTAALVPAPCMKWPGENMSSDTQGRRDEIALFQQTLRDSGYDPGEIDGYFGPNTWTAAGEQMFDSVGPAGLAVDLLDDSQEILSPFFQRLGIVCPPSGYADNEEPSPALALSVFNTARDHCNDATTALGADAPFEGGPDDPTVDAQPFDQVADGVFELFDGDDRLLLVDVTSYRVTGPDGAYGGLPSPYYERCSFSGSFVGTSG
jgi:hypothetical protein